MLKTLALVLVCSFAASPALAAQTILEIVRPDGTVQPVTDEDFKAIGETTLTTPLFSQPDSTETTPAVRTAKGPLLRDVLKHFQVSGAVAQAVGLDAYQIDIPVEDAMRYDVILATELDGKQLSVRDRGPIWVLYPLKDHPELNTPVYESRSIWQLKKLQLK